MRGGEQAKGKYKDFRSYVPSINIHNEWKYMQRKWTKIMIITMKTWKGILETEKRSWMGRERKTQTNQKVIFIGTYFRGKMWTSFIANISGKIKFININNYTSDNMLNKCLKDELLLTFSELKLLKNLIKLENWRSNIALK